MRRDLRGLIPPRPEDFAQSEGIPKIPLPPGLHIRERGGAVAPCQTTAIVHLAFPLQCMTPVVGGGVEKQTPDTAEILRIPAIRGQLRMWWRALQPEPTKPTDTKPTDKLFHDESALWGGVSGEADGDAKKDTQRSRVVLQVRGATFRADLPAGRHEGSDGRYRALPNWDGGRPMGYGLFPLQLPRETLSRLKTADPPTASVRHGLTFTLEVTVSLRGDLEAAKNDLRQVLGSLWAWIHLGGIGARTTRGFGALSLDPSEIAKNAAIELIPGSKLAPTTRDALYDELRRLVNCFEPPKRPDSPAFVEWLQGAAKQFQWPSRGSSQRSGYHPRLPAKGWCLGPPRREAKEAHSEGLAMLMDFRQRPGVGRNPGQQRGRPGRSRWPEADTMRRLALSKRPATFRVHPPKSRDLARSVAPRGRPLACPSTSPSRIVTTSWPAAPSSPNTAPVGPLLCGSGPSAAPTAALPA
jgi:CRISPR-associated protein Cmr1